VTNADHVATQMGWSTTNHVMDMRPRKFFDTKRENEYTFGALSLEKTAAQ